MKQNVKSGLKFIVRWGVAIVGVWLVVHNITLRDRVTLVDYRTASKTDAHVVGKPRETDARFTIIALDKEGHEIGPERTVGRDELWARPDRTTVMLRRDGNAPRSFKLLAVHPAPRAPANDPRSGSEAKAMPDYLLVQDPGSNQNQIVPVTEIANIGQFRDDHIVYPRLEVGLIRMVQDAKLIYLLAALSVIPISMLITTFRWHLLLEAVGIHIGIGRTFAINMVGLFYNTFMLGSTGGDLVKAWYASRNTPHRTWAVISVVMDRGIGLLALIILGGAMAACQWQVTACRQVAIIAGVVLLATAAGFLVFYSPFLRRATGFDFLLGKMPAQRFLKTAVKGLEMYGHDHPKKTIQALLISFPVHMAGIISATLAGHALGLKNLPLMYYWVIIPVIALVGAIPIAPQGAGVMEGFAILLTQGQGVTASQAVGLTLAFRMIQIFWNLVAGLFLLKGDYHPPTESEKHELESDDPGEKDGTPPTPASVLA